MPLSKNHIISKQFQTSIKVTPDVLDESNHVNNVEYLRWVQYVSELHWNTIVDEETKEKYAWMALDHHIQYKKQAFLDDVLSLKTYISNNTAATVTRIVEIYREDVLITKATTNWCMVNKESKRPGRIPSDILSLFI